MRNTFARVNPVTIFVTLMIAIAFVSGLLTLI